MGLNFLSCSLLLTSGIILRPSFILFTGLAETITSQVIAFFPGIVYKRTMRLTKTKTMTIALLAIGVILALVGLNFQRLLVRTLINSQADYFNTPSTTGAKLEQLTPRVYTFNWYFDRTLIIDTEEGLVVVDPFSVHLTGALREALAKAGLNKPVHTLIYTHYHLDHVRGGANLHPQHVLAHRKCPEYWADFTAAETADIVSPTRLLDGDVELSIGGTPIKLLYQGLSHTDTMYAVYLPDESLVYLADTVGVKVFLPGGGIALYTPGYMRALDRIAALDFTIFVASHFGHGSKQDYLDAVQLQKDIHGLVRKAMAKHEGPVPTFMEPKRMLAFVDDVYPALKERYGDWHGFSSQALSSIFAAYTAQYVGD